MKVKRYLFFLFLSGWLESNAQTAWTQQDLEREGFMTTSVHSRLTATGLGKPQTLVTLQQYTPTQLQLQEVINNHVSESVVVYAPVSDPSEWTAIDREDITPYTWQWVDLQQVHANGDTTQISLRRPTWWLKEIHAHQVGDVVMLDLPDMGIHGPAVVTNIRPNQLDTRVWHANKKDGYTTSPITGKFVHHSHDVYKLFFGDTGKPVGVTGNHRFWSVDRNTWVMAAALNIGEKVKTTQGWQVLNQRTKQDHPETVYNLEIYRVHNYMVSESTLLVHNECWSMHWNKVRVGMGDKVYAHSDVATSGPLRVLVDGRKAAEFGFEMMGYEMGSLTRIALKSGKKRVVVKVDITRLGMFEKRRLENELFTGPDTKRVGADEVDDGKTYRTWEVDVTDYPDFSGMQLPSDDGFADNLLDEIMKNHKDDGGDE